MVKSTQIAWVYILSLQKEIESLALPLSPLTSEGLCHFPTELLPQRENKIKSLAKEGEVIVILKQEVKNRGAALDFYKVLSPPHIILPKQSLFLKESLMKFYNERKNNSQHKLWCVNK